MSPNPRKPFHGHIIKTVVLYLLKSTVNFNKHDISCLNYLRQFQLDRMYFRSILEDTYKHNYALQIHYSGKSGNFGSWLNKLNIEISCKLIYFFNNQRNSNIIFFLTCLVIKLDKSYARKRKYY